MCGLNIFLLMFLLKSEQMCDVVFVFVLYAVEFSTTVLRFKNTRGFVCHFQIHCGQQTDMLMLTCLQE